jgi:hypothetical protein
MVERLHWCIFHWCGRRRSRCSGCEGGFVFRRGRTHEERSTVSDAFWTETNFRSSIPASVFTVSRIISRSFTVRSNAQPQSTSVHSANGLVCCNRNTVGGDLSAVPSRTSHQVIIPTTSTREFLDFLYDVCMKFKGDG